MECIVKNTGAALDIRGLTAKPGYVKKGKTFIGQGSDEEQIGTMPIIDAADHVLTINGEYQSAAGYYAAGSRIVQNIPTMEQQYIIPSGEQQTVETKDKYMIEDVVIAGLPNLNTFNIKKGTVIKLGDYTIIGVYEGYENNDPMVPYYNGVFAPGQSINSFPAFGRKAGEYYVGDVTFGRDNLHLENPLDTRYVTTAIVFNRPLNFDEINEIELRYSLDNATGGCSVLAATGYETEYIYRRADSGSGKTYHEGLGTYWQREIPDTNGNVSNRTLNVASVTGSRYLYISLSMRTTSSIAIANLTLRELKCKK